MLYLEAPPGIFTQWAGEPIDDVRHPLTIEQHWSDQELAGIGLYKPADAEPSPDGKVVVCTIIERVDGVVRYVNKLEDAPPASTDPVDYRCCRGSLRRSSSTWTWMPISEPRSGRCPDAMQRAATMSRYENSTEYRYEDPLVEPLRSAVGMPEAELIDAWMIAKDLRSSA